MCSKPRTTATSSFSTAGCASTSTTSRAKKSGAEHLGDHRACGITISAPSLNRPDHQPLLGLRHGIGAGRLRARRHVRQLRRPQPDLAAQSDFRPGRKHGARKSATSGSCSTGICWRRPRCSAPTSATPANWCGRLPTPAPSQAGAAYHVQGIDLGADGNITDKWSVYAGLVLMKTRVDHSAVPTNVGLPLAFVANQSFNLLTKYKLTNDLEVGGQATYRSKIYGGTLLAANQGTVLPDYWRFDAFLEGKVYKNCEVEAVRQQHLQQALLRRLLSKRGAVRAGRARPRRRRGADGQILKKF